MCGFQKKKRALVNDIKKGIKFYMIFQRLGENLNNK